MTFTFIKNHIYTSGLLGLVLLSSLIIAPFLLKADSQSGPSCNSPFDRDCDGVPACHPASVCDPDSPNYDVGVFGSSDLVDTDSSIGSVNSVIINAVQTIAN